jgi:hypothetical protein
MGEINLWQWRFTDENGKRRVTSWLMTEDTVREFAHVDRDALKVEGSLEVRNTGARPATFSTRPRSHGWPPRRVCLGGVPASRTW